MQSQGTPCQEVEQTTNGRNKYVVSCAYLQATFTLLPVRFMKAVACLLGGWHQNGKSRLKGDQLFDIICVGIFITTVLFLRHLNAGAIYFWIKDLTQEFLKLQVIYTAVELFDKVQPTQLVKLYPEQQ